MFVFYPSEFPIEVGNAVSEASEGRLQILLFDGLAYLGLGLLTLAQFVCFLRLPDVPLRLN